MFMAGGRLNGAKIGPAEKAAMYQYIEVFKQAYPEAHVHENLGYAEVELTPEQKIVLESDPNIHSICIFRELTLNTVQSSAPWHLSNISGSQYSSYEYVTDGEGVDVYIVDTGIFIEHHEFEGRAIKGMSFDKVTNPHGTHVAGIVGSKTYGVAKKCRLIDVKVFPENNDGAIWFSFGVDWVLGIHPQGMPGVVNMSLGGDYDPVADSHLYSAILSMLAEGLIVVVAAGNETVDTSLKFPSCIPLVITVGAIDNTNTIASFSNFGPGVDVFAPGVSVQSTVLNYATDIFSGTSMASPVVAGVCARYIQMCPETDFVKMIARIKNFAFQDVIVSGHSDTTNARVNVNMSGNKDYGNGIIGNLLNGEYRQRYWNDTAWVDREWRAYGEVSRLAIVKKFGVPGAMNLASEIIHVDIPIIQPPTVTPPMILPPNINYDGGVIVFNADLSVTYKGHTYVPSTIIPATLTYGDIGFTINMPASLPYMTTFNGNPITINVDLSVTYNAKNYTATSTTNATYNYSYPGIMVVTVVVKPNNQFRIIPISQKAIVPRPDVGDAEVGTWPDGMDVKLYGDKDTITETTPKRLIAIDIADPNKLASYSMNLQFASGTFNYSGVGLTKPANKTAVTVQGYNGLIERVADSLGVGQAPLTVEGRLLPLFSKEIIYIKKTEQVDGTAYETRNIVADIASMAGTTVTFNATNNKVKSFEFTGRFTQALEQIAELSCGRLLQQNGNWFIIPKHTVMGTFNVPADDIISLSIDKQSDVIDTISSLMGYLKDAILERDMTDRLVARAQNKLDHATTSEALPTDPTPTVTYDYPTYIKMGEISIAFGRYDNKKMQPMAENILVETHSSIDSWDYWNEGDKAPLSDYYKVEPICDDTGKIIKRRGLKTLEMVHLYYPINPPSNAAEYNATGTLGNLDCSLWGGGPTFAWSMHPVLKSKSVTGLGERPTDYCQTYFEFSLDILAVPFPKKSNEDTNYYYAKMELNYKPALMIPWKFTVSIDKTYRLFPSKNYLIPINGGAVLNKNGNTVAEFDRNARVIKLQSGGIIGVVDCEADTPPAPIVDPVTGAVSYTATIKGAPYNITAPATPPEGTTMVLSGPVQADKYVLRTKTNRLFGTINKTSGEISDVNGNYVGTYTTSNTFSTIGMTVDPLWGSKMGYVNIYTMARSECIGVVLNANDTAAGGYISFSDAVAYPPVSADTNYTTLTSTLAQSEKNKALLDKSIAEAKITCIKKELDYYGVDYSALITACEKWKIYYDAVELRDFPKIVTPPAVPATPPTDSTIKTYEITAITETGTAMAGINSAKPRELSVNVSFLYNNILPLAGNELKIGTKTYLPVLPAQVIIETVSYNGSTVSVTAKKGFKDA